MTEILKSFSDLQCELDVAKSTLKGVDENIKRLIGRDPSELPTRPPVKRNNNSTQAEERGRPRAQVNHNDDRRLPDRRFKNPRSRMFVQENEEPPLKKRTMGISVFQRLSDRPVHDDNQSKQHKGMISKVIVTPKEVPSRQERMNAQSRDATATARNKRMFGALLGTLQKFQQEETKLKTKEEKRAQLEKKIEEHEIKEKEEIKKERQELFFNRKKKQAEIKMIELKMIRMKEFSIWEESQKKRMDSIYTKTNPQIHFLPRKLNDAHKVLLEKCRKDIQTMIDKKRADVQEELMHIEERGKRVYEPRKFQQESMDHENDDHDDEEVTKDDSHRTETGQETGDNKKSPNPENTQNDNEVVNTETIGNQDIQNGENSNVGNKEDPQNVNEFQGEVANDKSMEVSSDLNEQMYGGNDVDNSFVSSSSMDYIQQVEATSSTNFNASVQFGNNIVIQTTDIEFKE